MRSEKEENRKAVDVVASCESNVRKAQPRMGRSIDGLPTWLHGFEYIGNPDDSGEPRVTNNCPDRAKRLKALGNAVVPQIPEIIGRAIMELEQ
jgi:DNA (cytosine-5)-methyltransferase 1